MTIQDRWGARASDPVEPPLQKAASPARKTAPALSLPSAILSWTRHWIALDKPSGLPSRPAPGHSSSALSQLEDWLRHEAPDSPAPGVVHRLDRDTSGVLLFSLSPRAHRALVRAFAERQLRKDYRAIVLGWPQPRRGLIDLPLLRNASNRMVVARSGQPARTRYETLRHMRGCALLAVHPLTGRTHQIRVHLSERGSPLLGDRVYGRTPLPSSLPRPPRLCLHAARLALPGDMVEALGPLESLAPPRPVEMLQVVPESPAGSAAQSRMDRSDSFLISAPDPPDLAAYLHRLIRSLPRR